MLTKNLESILRLHTHTHTHTHNCYRQLGVVDFYTNFVKNVNIEYKNLVEGGDFFN